MSDAVDDPVSGLMRILSERWVLTLALHDDDGGCPYPTPLFYTLVEPGRIGDHAAPLLVFASNPRSYHGELSGLGPTPAAAAIYLESERVGELRGVQLRGELICDARLSEAAANALQSAYLARHPIAEQPLATGGHRLYALVVTWAKLTDNRLGFGVHPIARFDGAWSEVKPSPT